MHLLLAQDHEYLKLLHELAPGRHAETVFQVVVSAVASGERETAWRFFRHYDGPVSQRMFLLSACVLGRPWLRLVLLLGRGTATA